LVVDRQKLEFKHDELVGLREAVIQKYKNYNDEFKKIVLNSEKSVLLPSYIKYSELCNKMKAAENSINDSKNKLGAFKSILSPEVWKEQASKFISESNMLELEKILIEEAKIKPYFNKEYKIFSDLREKIDKIHQSIDMTRKNIEDNDLLIDNVKAKINELQKQLNAIKDVYLDVEEGYY
jgi:exonuclease SbcC